MTDFSVLFPNIVSISQYGSLSTALSSIGSSVKTLVIDQPITLSATTTVPTNIFTVIDQAGSITKTVPCYLIFSGPFFANRNSAFVGFGHNAYLNTTPVVNAGGGLVNLSITNHGFTAGDYLYVMGTSFYNGANIAQPGTTVNSLQIVATYNAE